MKSPCADEIDHEASHALRGPILPHFFGSASVLRRPTGCMTTL